MGRYSARTGIIACALVAAGSIGGATMSPSAGVAQASSETSAPQLPDHEAVADEYIIQLEPNTAAAADAGATVSAQSAPSATFDQRVEEVMMAVAANDATSKKPADQVGAQSTQQSGGADLVTAELPSIFGFAAHLTPEQADLVEAMDGVKGVAPNIELDGGDATSLDPDVSLDDAATPWGLDRIDQPDLPLDGKYDPPATGSGSHIYVVGSGIWAGHEQFAGRIGEGVSLVPEDDPAQNEPGCFAQGTADASAAAGATLGVATEATLHSVRIKGCYGGLSLVRLLQAVEWIAAHAPPRSVVLMRVIGLYSTPINDAIAYLDRLGITTVVPSDTTQASSTTSWGDACNLSPPSAPLALTVAPTDASDHTTDFASTGNCIDLYAPGVEIPVAGVDDPTAVVADSGSTTAAALAAGAVALYLEQHPDALPAQARAAVGDAAVTDRIRTGDVLAPNRLLNISAMGPSAPPPKTSKPIAHIVQPPVAGVGEQFELDGSLSLDATGGKNLTYQWRRIDAVGVVSTAPTLTASYNRVGSYPFTLTVTDVNGVSDSTFVWVEVDQPRENYPVVKWTSSIGDEVPDGTTGTFDASESYDPDGGDVKVAWDVYLPGTGKQRFTGPTLTYTFTASSDGLGQYYIFVVVTDDEGSKSEASISVLVSGPSTPGGEDPPAEGDVVAGRYIVEFAEPSELAAGDLHERVETLMAKVGAANGARVHAEIESVNGFSASLDPDAVSLLQSLPEVRAVYPERVYRTDEVSVSESRATAARPTDKWGLDRIDQTDLPGDGSYDPPNDGSGVHIYVVDMGIWPEHAEFEGRLGDGTDVIGGDTVPYCFFHGTHVAGIAAGKTAGVAAESTLHSVRVLNCDGEGTTSEVLKGIDWIADHLEMPAVVNFSLGASHDEALNTAIGYLTARGATVVAAAGNESAEACPRSPAGSSQATTVAASFLLDYTTGFTNFGRCVDLWAPGSWISAAGISGPNDFATYSGTSMASPFVAGAAALYLYQYPDATPAQVRDALRRGATVDHLKGVIGDTPNLLLNVSDLPAPDPSVVSSAPVAHIAQAGRPLAGRRVTFDGSASTTLDGGEVSYEWRVSNSPKVAGTGPTMSYTFDTPGEYRVALRVTDAAGDSSSTVTEVSVAEPQDPLALFEPGEDQYVIQGSSLTFDGSKSNDPDGGELTFAWRTSGSATVVSTEKVYSRSFPDLGRVGVQLTVTDDEGVSVSKQISVWVSKPQDPLALFDPGEDQYVTQGSSLTFDGSQSNDPDGGELTFAWRTSGSATVVSTEKVYSRSFPDLGRVGVQLTVTDDEGVSATKHIDVWVSKPQDPLALFDPGEDQYVIQGSELTFDGSRSNDPDGGEVTFAWKTTGKGLVSRAKTYTRSFPDEGRVGVELTVTDDEGVSATKHINVWVSKPQDPLALFDPGEDQYVTQGSEITFDASKSRDPDGGDVTFVWKTTRFGVVSTRSTYSRSFPEQGRVGVELIVTDDEGVSATKHINVWVWGKNPQDPIATFEPATDQTIKVGSILTFDGSKSNDPDGGDLEFGWYRTGDGLVSNGREHAFWFPKTGKFGIELRVRDNEGRTAKKHIYVTVVD